MQERKMTHFLEVTTKKEDDWMVDGGVEDDLHTAGENEKGGLVEGGRKVVEHNTLLSYDKAERVH